MNRVIIYVIWYEGSETEENYTGKNENIDIYIIITIYIYIYIYDTLNI